MIMGHGRRERSNGIIWTDWSCVRCSPLRVMYGWLHKADWQLIPGAAHSCSAGTTMVYRHVQWQTSHVWMRPVRRRAYSSVSSPSSQHTRMRTNETEEVEKRNKNEHRKIWVTARKPGACIHIAATMRFSKHTKQFPSIRDISASILWTPLINSVAFHMRSIRVRGYFILAKERLPPRTNVVALSTKTKWCRRRCCDAS